jgi:DNA recombination protein RmuC
MSELLLLASSALVVAVVVAASLGLPARVVAALRADQGDRLGQRLESLERALERLDRTQRAEAAAGRGEASRASAQLREEVERRLESVRATVEQRLELLRQDNATRLDQVRLTVDEKLQGTLERRLGDSFRLVSERLEAVQRGLGEMQTLATGVGDLKKVLSNVKVRGTWGEVQLRALLEQVLAPDQWAANVATRRGSLDRVECCVRLPGPEAGAPEVLLPIDAKFPVEDWQRLVEASERADAAGVEAAGLALERRLRACAQEVHDKYLDPPRTTDFAILFLPTEGLYAEVVRRAGLTEGLQRDWKISVAGPTTLAALLNSLQLGFRTLAIQRRSSEVWQVLGGVKAEFTTFGAVLEKVEKKLQEASNQIHQVGVRRRALERALREVQTLPAGQASGARALDPPVGVEATPGAGAAAEGVPVADGDDGAGSEL